MIPQEYYPMIISSNGNNSKQLCRTAAVMDHPAKAAWLHRMQSQQQRHGVAIVNSLIEESFPSSKSSHNPHHLLQQKPQHHMMSDVVAHGYQFVSQPARQLKISDSHVFSQPSAKKSKEGHQQQE